MSQHRAFELPESHLLPDAVVAFVDDELSLGASERAAEHLAHCPGCASDVKAQRQARTAVQQAQTPSISPGFLASLCSIPEHTDIDGTPDNLAVTDDGQLVAVQRPDEVAGLSTTRLDGSTRLGQSETVLGNGSRLGGGRRRSAQQGAGVVVSGLVLSALALVTTTASGGTAHENDARDPGTPPAGVLRAHLGGDDGGPSTTTVTPSTPAPTGPHSEHATSPAPPQDPDAPVAHTPAAVSAVGTP